MNITLRQFRYFVTVAEAGSVSAAARHLNLSQSAITAAVIELEESLGVSLFERSSRGVALTPEGHRFLASARRVIGSVADAVHALRAEPQALGGKLAIGVTPLVAGYYLSELLARFARSHPGVDVEVTEDEPRFLEHLLINGEVDVAIMVASALADRQALTTEILSSSRNRVWLATSHRLAGQDDVELAELADEPIVMLAADRIDDALREIWMRRGLVPRTLLRTSSLEAVRSLVGAGMGVTILPDFLYRPWSLEADRVEARSLRDELAPVDIGLVWRRGLPVNVQGQEFIEVAREQSLVRNRRVPQAQRTAI
ncbi:MAG: LysR family transcriptional regulator [Burkholderiales bacterium]|nr:MAG: LysR family transcriptional regulator [Burkholderiales bacterium]